MQNRQSKDDNKIEKQKKPRVNPALFLVSLLIFRKFQAKKEPGAVTKKEAVKKETKTAKRPKPAMVSIKKFHGKKNENYYFLIFLGQ